MTALTAGYATAIAALLFAAAVATTIIVSVNALFDSTDEQPSRKETARKVAA